MAELKNPVAPSQKIRAAVLRKRGGPLEIESLEMEGPRDDEVLVRIVATGICRTDIDIIDEWDNSDVPAVLGHEGAGVVVKTGRSVKSVSPGDHVILSYLSCGHCHQCRRGRPWECRYLYEANFGLKRLDGSNALQRSGVRGHFFGQSSFATHSLATERNIVKIPRDLPLDILSPLGCGFQTGAGTVMNTLDIPRGAGIAVFGTGSVGLAAIMAARIVGADPIIGVDINPGRLRLALELGATHVINNRREDIASRIAGITGGVDYVLEITGDPEMLRMAIAVLNPRGTAALFTGEGGPGPLPEGRKTVSVVEGSSVPQTFIPRLIKLYLKGLFAIDRIEKFYDFADINRAIADAKRGDTIKPVLRVNEKNEAQINL
jgi:aryl-alcohol dehydrogenase